MDKKALIAIFAFGIIFFGNALFAVYTENIQVQVLDTLYRPIPHAQVSVQYVLNSDYGPFATPPRETNDSGMVKITFSNTEQNPADVVYGYTVIARYMNGSGQTAQTVGNHGPTILVQIPAHVINIVMRDQYGSPAPGTITIGGTVKETDQGGSASILVADGNYDMAADYLGSTQVVNLDVENDTAKTFTFRVYSPQVKVVDDNNYPLIADVVMGNYTARTAGSGIATFPRTANPGKTVTVKYNGMEFARPVVFGVEQSNLIVLDLTPPNISDVKATYDSGIVILSAKIEDPGVYPSGFGSNTEFAVNYTTGTNKRKTFMYPTSRDTFQAEIPTLDQNDIVYYTITASDNDGNTNRLSGKFQISGNPSQGNGSIIPIIPVPTPSGQDNTMLYAGAGVVLLVLVLGGYYYKKRKDEEGSG